MAEPKKIYLIKYAMTAGITLEMVKDERDDGFVYLEGYSWSSFKLGRDAAKTREEAVALVCAMRAKKVASLRKQIAKLDAMDVEKAVPHG